MASWKAISLTRPGSTTCSCLESQRLSTSRDLAVAGWDQKAENAGEACDCMREGHGNNVDNDERIVLWVIVSECTKYALCTLVQRTQLRCDGYNKIIPATPCCTQAFTSVYIQLYLLVRPILRRWKNTPFACINTHLASLQRHLCLLCTNTELPPTIAAQ